MNVETCVINLYLFSTKKKFSSFFYLFWHFFPPFLAPQILNYRPNFCLKNWTMNMHRTSKPLKDKKCLCFFGGNQEHIQEYVQEYVQEHMQEYPPGFLGEGGT